GKKIGAHLQANLPAAFFERLRAIGLPFDCRRSALPSGSEPEPERGARRRFRRLSGALRSLLRTASSEDYDARLKLQLYERAQRRQLKSKDEVGRMKDERIITLVE